jgi:hypothetical protein
VVDRGGEAGLTLEALAKALIPGELGGHHLERDGALEAQLGGAVDDAHAAAAELCLDAAAGEGWCGAGAGSHKRRGAAAAKGRRSSPLV